MNKFKNYIWMAAGFAVLAAVISGITAGPALAALVKAALVRDVDNPARNYITLELYDGSTYTVPAGKILVLEQILGGSQNFTSNNGYLLKYDGGTTQGNDNRWDRWITVPPFPGTSGSIAQPFHVYVNGGQTIKLSEFAPGTGSQLFFQGYLIDAS